MKTSTIAGCLALSAFLFSCKKQGVSETPSSIVHALKTTHRTAAVNRTAAATVQWTSGTASVRQIKFEAKTTGWRN